MCVSVGAVPIDVGTPASRPIDRGRRCVVLMMG